MESCSRRLKLKGAKVNTKDSNRNLLFTHMQSLTTRLTDIQEQVEKLIAFSTEQLQMHAMEIEQLQGEVEKLQASIHLLDQKIRDLAK